MEYIAQDIIHEAIEILIRVNRHHHRIADSKMKDIGIHPAQHRMLMLIDMGIASSQKEISELMHISPAVVTVTLQKLKAEGLIETVSAKEDKRINRIELTSKATGLLSKANYALDELDRELFNGFSEDEIKQLTMYLKKMQENEKNLGEVDL